MPDFGLGCATPEMKVSCGLLPMIGKNGDLSNAAKPFTI